ncbi:uncharacterized protein LOC113512105 isoform X2 [Galleria mellonella]|uniref:Uncharacterized protein LOC113512105 isoform X2 n=1 Tax=Galleria mellonella TaxID=7137 RepID=A0A6J3BUQ3_GALME|nr:uncharacterized protein LOC113512105 isoform X2 [Galleria mellonella]
MYHYQNHPYYQDHSYQNNQQCTSFQQEKSQNGSSSIQHNVYTVLENVPTSQDYTTTVNKNKSEVPPKEKSKLYTKKSVVDTSNFTIEERLVAAVWVHERKRSKTTLGHIKKEFRQRFGREPPAKNTLLAWERKLFTLGSVHDAPRPGRPINRRIKIEEVAASVRSAPSLSLRERAVALRLSRTTLHTILHKDLQHTLPTRKQIKKRRAKTENIKKPQATAAQYDNSAFAQPAAVSSTPSAHLLATHGFT